LLRLPENAFEVNLFLAHILDLGKNQQAKSHRHGRGIGGSPYKIRKSSGDRINREQPVTNGASKKFSTTYKAPLAVNGKNLRKFSRFYLF
jgi:hypothetical protein